ncbi:protein MCM10 homolog isoform X2 [Dreissena polymorpha]|uniref:protein MCM10 homolog isoform X2 n=1 Tax=Dreissena polymorpha TaxID=45954 RepID=UPI0022644F9B|nr:protein MCM10 homolog isoform X2 [Dreissena polymorpha]
MANETDECELEELTAFLESSDDDIDAGHEPKTSQQNTNEDEFTQAEIEAFLQESSDDEPEEVVAQSDHHGIENADKNNTDELMAEDLAELDGAGSTAGEPNKEADCSDMQATSGLMDNQSENNEMDVDQSDNRAHNGNQSESSKEAVAGVPELAVDAIKAEMEAMARRMQQLQEMLNSTAKTPQSSQDSTSPQTLKAQKTNQDSHKPSVKSPSTAKSSKQLAKSPDKPISFSGVSKTKSVVLEKSSVSGKKLSPKALDGKTKPELDVLERVTSTLSGNKSEKPRSASSAKTMHPSVNHKNSSSQKCVTSNTGVDDNPFFSGPNKELTASELFGESDDSDWEDLAGEEKVKLSSEGEEIKKLIKTGEQKRQAHAPSYDPALIKKPVPSRWTDMNTVPKRSQPAPDASPKLNPETGTVSGKYCVREEFLPKTTSLLKEDERESVTDPFCGIRIVNPRISMEEFRRKMDGRHMVKISRLASKPGHTDLQKDNWVTMGVVVHKTEPRQSAAGKTFCIWKLSDLQHCDRTVTFFLFGNVYKDHWKNDLGVVIGLLNPSVMDKAEKNQSEVAITINHPQQLLLMGVSKDLGRCRATTKSGQPCSSFINKQQGEYCTYHVQAAYKKSSSKRTELQASTGVVPKAFDGSKRKSKDGCFFYGGNTYTTVRQHGQKAGDKMTLTKLQSFDSHKVPGRVTTMSLHELEPEDHKKLQKLKEKDKNLLTLLSVPTVGSMNFVKHLVKKDATASLDGKESLEVAPPPSAKDLLSQHRVTLHQQQRQQQQQREILTAVPTIGKGLSAGQEVVLDIPLRKKTNISAELAKQLAIAKVKARGGISKDDPNAVKKKLTSPEAKEKIKKRVAEVMDADAETSPKSQGGVCMEPPKKRSKLLGDLDLNSPEVQQLLKTKSKNTGALAEAEAEHTDRYFGELEKRERMEDKMASIKEVEVNLVVCNQCRYKNVSLHERCKKENHLFTRTKGKRRFFKCKNCKHRTTTYDKLPTEACSNCGSSNFERVSMLQERKGPKLESEELCLRGNEQKFLGSIQGNAFLSA